MTQPPRPFVKGLDGVVAVQTELSSIDGQRGVLTYRGINIHELAEQATYEEVCYLLLMGKLPNRAELADFQARLAAQRALPAGYLDLLRTLPREAAPMDALRTAVSALAFYEPAAGDLAVEATQRKAVTLIAQMPAVVAAVHRLRHGQEPIAPRADLGQAANALYLLNGQEPDRDFASALDLYFTLLADHGMNASTFTARVVASTNADVHTAVTAAMAALKGPLHGGANEATMKMLIEIGEPGNVDAFVDNAFATKRKIMGFGHRIYKTGDPRVTHLQKRARLLGEKVGQLKYFDMSLLVEKAILRHKELYPNVDYFSATLLYYSGVPIDLFTPMFACSRMVGWCAHVIEQHKDAVLIRPQSEYIGATDQHYVPIDQR
jgi:citrate synthase